MKHLVKRSSGVADTGNINYENIDLWLCDVKRNGMPNGSKAEVGDEIYLAETGYAIYGRGKIVECHKELVDSKSKLIKYALSKARGPHMEKFWYRKLKEYYNHADVSRVGILEVKVQQLEQYDSPFALERRFLNQSSWYYLEDEFNLENTPLFNETLSPVIPGKLRKECFHRYRLKSNSFIFDVDHHVPKSLGGPGNILENLIPLGASLNRAKSNAVPSGVFLYATEFGIKLSETPKIDAIIYHNHPKLLAEAKRVITEINKDFGRAREIYSDIKKFHFPNINHEV